MTSQTVKLNNIPVQIGLEWELLEGASERKAQRDILKNNPGVKAGVLVRSADIAVMGLMGPKQKKPSAPSGAALLALANQDTQSRGSGQSSSIEDNQWIVVEKLADDQYWVVDIKDGVPLPGADVLLTYEGVRDYFDDMLEAGGFKVFTTDLDIQDAVDQKATIVNKSAGELIAEIEKPSRGNLKTVSGVDPMIVIVIVVFVALVAGFFGWDYYRKNALERQRQQQASQRASEDAARLAEEKRTYVAAIEKAVVDALDQGVNSVNGALQTPAPGDVMGAWIGIIENLPFNHSGWSLQSVECGLETPEKPICTVRLARSTVGINRILLEDFPQVEIEGDAASYVVRGPDLAMRSADWNQLPNARALMMGLISDLQFVRSIGLSYNQAGSQDITQAITMPTPPASVFSPGSETQNVAPPPVNTGVARGQLGLTGNGLWQVSGLTPYLDLAGISALSLNVELKNRDKQDWQLQTDYFIRSLPSPVLPVVIGPDGPISVEIPERHRSLVSQEEVQGNLPASEAAAPAEPAPETGTSPAPTPEEPLSIGLPDSPPTP